MNTAIVERLIAALLLGFALAGVAWFARPPARLRGRSHARWGVRATLGFVVPTVVGLAVLGRLAVFTELPPEFTSLAERLPRLRVADLAAPIALGMAAGFALIALRIGVTRCRQRPLPRRFIFPAPLAATQRHEIGAAIAVSLWAGISEEIAFRLGLPFLFTLVTGQPLLGFGLATALFVALHRYQPWHGQLLVGLAAILFAALYLSTGALWFVMLIHAAMDVLGLAVRPWLAGFNV